MRLRRPRYDVPETVVRQLKRRRRTRLGIFAALLLLGLSAVLDRAGFLRYRGDDWRNFDRQEVVVTDVIDGDTIRIRVSPAAPQETVRLLGIDAPETHPMPAHWATESVQRLQELTDGRPVTLRLDTTQTRDKYRRLLAYLYRDNADNVNLALVRDGHAYAHRRFPHSLRRQFEQAEDEARGKQRGLWADVTREQMPAWRQAWLAERQAHRK